MSILSLILLLVLVYYCAKAVGNIWHDAFGTIGATDSGRKQQRAQQQTTTRKAKPSSQKPILQGEGEYVDYEEL